MEGDILSAKLKRNGSKPRRNKPTLKTYFKEHF